MQILDLRQPAPPGPRLRTLHFVLLAFLALSLAFALSLWQYERAADRAAQVRAGQRQVEQARSELQTFLREHPNIGEVTALESRVERLNQALGQRRNTLQELEARSGLRTFSFYSFLRTLANQRIDGAWLTRFRLEIKPESGSLQVDLAGLSEDPALLAEYLDNLRAGGLRSIRFNNLRLRQSTDTPQPLYAFQINTAEQAEAVGEELRRTLPDTDAEKTPRPADFAADLADGILQQSLGGDQ